MNLEEEFLKLKSTVQELKDRQDILDCIQRESRARDRQDVAMIESCWWGDGVDEHGAVVSKAFEYAARANKGHSSNFNMTSHNITNCLCEIKGDTAYCESWSWAACSGLTAKRPRSRLGDTSISWSDARENGALSRDAAPSRCRPIPMAPGYIRRTLRDSSRGSGTRMILLTRDRSSQSRMASDGSGGG